MNQKNIKNEIKNSNEQSISQSKHVEITKSTSNSNLQIDYVDVSDTDADQNQLVNDLISLTSAPIKLC